MNWEKKRVFVTGADGFIGSHLTEALVQVGAKVRAMVFHNAHSHWGWLDDLSPDVLKDVEVVEGDISDPGAMRNLIKEVEIVFHLAALIAVPFSYISPISYIRTNVMGTVNVLQAAQEAGAELVIHTSTSEVYGDAQKIPMDEGHPLNAQSPYAATKVAADQMALSIHRSTALPVAILRPFNTYGPRQSTRAVIPTIITQALEGDGRIFLGNTTPTRDFLYVEDAVRGFLLMATSEDVVGRIVGIGTGVETSIAELVKIIGEILGKELRVLSVPERVRPRQSEIERLCCDSSLARRILGWEPHILLREGLERTINWYKKQPKLFRPEIYRWKL